MPLIECRPLRTGRHRKAGATFVFAAMLLACEVGPLSAQPVPSPIIPPHGSQLSVEQTATALPPPASTSDTFPKTTWDVVHMGGGKVGFSRTTVDQVPQAELQEFSSESEITLQRFGEAAKQQLRVTSTQHPDGRLVRFSCATLAGTSKVVTDGHIDGEKLIIETTTQGMTSRAELPWPTSARSFFAVEESLWQQPMRAGERRSLRMLLPVFYQIVDVQLIADDFEEVSLLDGTRRLLRVTNRTTIAANQVLDTILWVDRSGEIWKTLLPSIGQTTYRTTEQVARNSPLQTAYDLGRSSVVRLATRPANPHAARELTYNVRLRDGDPASQFVNDSSQSVRLLDPHRIQLVVRAVRPDSPLPPATRTTLSGVQPDDLRPSNFIQSDDPLIQSLAQEVLPDERDPWKLAVALENYVHHAIQAKDFSQAMATAAEVAKSLQGDCTEHAVLLAALCRARGIPARAAIGLVYFAPEQGFAYHMWNEVWIADRWVPVDATLGLGGIGAGHLKLAVSSLSGAAAYGAFLPVFQVLGRLDVEIVEQP